MVVEIFLQDISANKGSLNTIRIPLLFEVYFCKIEDKKFIQDAVFDENVV